MTLGRVTLLLGVVCIAGVPGLWGIEDLDVFTVPEQKQRLQGKLLLVPALSLRRKKGAYPKQQVHSTLID